MIKDAFEENNLFCILWSTRILLLKILNKFEVKIDLAQGKYFSFSSLQENKHLYESH